MADNTNNKRHIVICGKGGGGSSTVTWDDIQDKPEFATVATTGDYDDLTDKPTIPAAPVQSDWNEADSTSLAYIQNKPSIPAAQVNADWNAVSGVAEILNKPTIPTVPTDVSAFNNDAGYLDSTDLKDELVDTYNFFYEDPDTGDLTPNWVDFGSMNDELYNYGILSIDAGTGDYVYEPDYNDLQNKPTIPAAQVNSDWNSASGVSQILNKPTLATVATTGSYNDLTDKPTVTQEQADWNQTDNTQVDYIKNKPTIPSETETLTFTLQGGTVVSLEVYVKPDNSPYFYVENNDSSDITFDIVNNNYDPANPFDLDIFGSTDQENWNLIGNTINESMTATVPANGRLYIKANTDSWTQWSNNAKIKFNISDPVNVGGNIMSLLYGDDYKGKKFFPTNSNNNFNSIFANCTIVSAEDLILPAITLTQSCYESMFQDCTSLTTAPALPATTLANSCYNQMFLNCTSLTTAPAILPATTLADYCYSAMFYYCESLTTAPALPATTLATECYSNMFEGCTSLTTAPALPATTLTENCYSGMFYGCTSLTTSPVLPAATLAIGCYMSMFSDCSSLDTITTYAEGEVPDALMSWVDGVSASGDFYNLGNYQYYTSGANGIPTGWTEHTSL